MILHSCFSILACRFSIVGSRFSILDSQFSILDSRFSTLASRLSILDSRSSNLDFRFWVLLTVHPCQANLHIYIYIYTWSLHYPSFLGSFAKHLFFGYFRYFLGSFHAKKAFYLPSSWWEYTLCFIKLDHLSVLCFSCLMLDQPPLHSSQTQAHD